MSASDAASPPPEEYARRLAEALTTARNCLDLITRHTDNGGILRAARSGIEAADNALSGTAGGWSYDMVAAEKVARKASTIIVAVPSKRGAPIVGEAYFDPDAYGGTWWWGNTSAQDWGSSCIEDGNDGRPFAWQPFPAPPGEEAAQC